MFYAELCLVKYVYKYADIEVEGCCMQPINSSMYNFKRYLEDSFLLTRIRSAVPLRILSTASQ
jgi:hypothetical protein